MNIVTVGIDLAKNIFALHGVDQTGKAVLVKPKVRRAAVLRMAGIGATPDELGREEPAWTHQPARRRLPTDRDRWLQPISALLPRIAVYRGGRCEAGVYPAVQGVWSAQTHSHRQWRAVCHDHAGPALQPVGLVGAAGRVAGIDRTRQTAAKRPA